MFRLLILLTYCVCGLLFAACRFIDPLVCGLPPVATVGSVVCVGFLVEETSACVLVFEAGFVFLVGRSTSSGVFWGVCDLIMIFGSLSANG